MTEGVAEVAEKANSEHGADRPEIKNAENHSVRVIFLAYQGSTVNFSGRARRNHSNDGRHFAKIMTNENRVL